MILAFSLGDIIRVPFGFLLGLLYDLTQNYGAAMLIFAVLVQLILLPITAKSKKSMMAMSRLTPKLQELQKKYGDDQQKLNEATQALYREQGVSMGGGCLWSLVPMFILIPLFAVIRQPIHYVLMESAETAAQIVELIKGIDASQFSSNSYYHEVTAAALIPQYAAQIKAAIPDINPDTLKGIDFIFLGIDMGAIPQWQIWKDLSWANLGAVLVALCSAGSQVVSMLVSQKMNNSVVTDKNGVQDEETAKNSQQAQSGKMMMYMMPLMSLWIGFTVPCALSLYWFVGGVVRTIEEAFLTVRYRKIYDAEDAIRLKAAMERDAAEAEKERIRAERRAANPDGITENTSKKKMQKKQKAEEDAAKAAAAREYAAKKGIVIEEENKTEALSGIADRPYCKGRAYDPNRYSRTTEE